MQEVAAASGSGKAVLEGYLTAEPLVNREHELALRLAVGPPPSAVRLHIAHLQPIHANVVELDVACLISVTLSPAPSDDHETSTLSTV